MSTSSPQAPQEQQVQPAEPAYRPKHGSAAAAPATDAPAGAARQARLPLRARLATTVGGAAGHVSRLAGRGDGSVIGGVIGLKLKPDLLTLLTTGRQVVMVTGTNGKTTTTRLITSALGTLGQRVASNAFGANMEAGLVSALAKAPDATIAVLEVDEKHVPAMLRKTAPRVLVLLNLSRDQMDRAAEIWLLARRWREALAAAPDCRVIANADDPLVAWAAGEARQVTWVSAGQRWHDDSWCCPNCGAHLRRDGDDWHCLECSYRRPPVRWMLLDGQVVDPAGLASPLDLELPGRANQSNAVMALAVAEEFGVGVGQVLPAIARVSSVAGRYTQVSRHGCELRLLLAKNPAGWLEALDVLVPDGPVLLAVNAQGPDGRDTSWLWDVDYRRLRGRPVFVTGERRTDLAVRLEADEVLFRVAGSVDDAIELASSPSMEVLANYTAFQQIRAVLGRTVLEDMMSESALRVVWIYPDLLSTYGDRGNMLVLARRAQLRGTPVEVAQVNSDQRVPADGDIYLLGGGEDLPQILAASRLRTDGGLSTAVDRGAVVLAVCAGYQIIGTEFGGVDGEPVPGLGLLDIRSGRGDRRGVGEILADVDPDLDGPGPSVGRLTGFENHQGVTHRGSDVRALATVITGVGNGDGTEGAYAGKVVGTYLHGPALVRNPALADLLLGWVLGTPLPAIAPQQERLVQDLRRERLTPQPS